MSAEETNIVEKTDSEVAEKEVKGKKPAYNKPRQQRAASQTSEVDVDVEERVVSVQRVAKVVKGGRRFSFSALVVAGDKKGRVGYGLGKAKEVPDAIRKASQEAKSKMITVPVENGTVPHEVLGEYDAGKVLFRPASEGTGVKAAGACRSIMELVGIKNVLTKSLRGNNPHNIVKATFTALKMLRSSDQIAKNRGIEVNNVRIK